MRRAAAGLLVLLALSGCTTPPPQPATPEVTWTASAPADGVTLTQLGFRNGPAEFWLPSGVVIRDRVDLEANITVTITSPGGAELAAWLRRNLPAAGFEITADGQDSLLFRRGQWQGAFTLTAALSALSLRTDREQ
jgi:lipoprotein